MPTGTPSWLQEIRDYWSELVKNDEATSSDPEPAKTEAAGIVA